MTKTTAEELAEFIYDMSAAHELTHEDCQFFAQAILASPVIAKIEREAEMRVVEWLRKANPYDFDYEQGGMYFRNIARSIATAIEAGQHKEKAGG